MDYFKALDTFVRVARSGSFAAAAGELGLSRAMVSKTIGELEARFGVRLVNRTTRRVSPTDAGAELYEFATRLLAEVANQDASMGRYQAQAVGTLKILAPRTFGSLHLGRALAEFSLENPDIAVTLIVDTPTTRELEFSSQYDISIRVDPIASTNVVARRLGSVRWVVCGSPKYLRRRGAPKSPADLASHNCLLHSDGFPYRSWKIGKPPDTQDLHVHGTFISNSVLALRDAAIGGLGLTFLPTYSCEEALRSGVLVRVLEAWEIPDTPLYALIASNKFIPKKLRTLLDFLSDWAAREL